MTGAAEGERLSDLFFPPTEFQKNSTPEWRVADIGYTPGYVTPAMAHSGSGTANNRETLT
jgi:hypothetical protein